MLYEPSASGRQSQTLTCFHLRLQEIEEEQEEKRAKDSKESKRARLRASQGAPFYYFVPRGGNFSHPAATFRVKSADPGTELKLGESACVILRNPRAPGYQFPAPKPIHYQESLLYLENCRIIGRLSIVLVQRIGHSGVKSAVTGTELTLED